MNQTKNGFCVAEIAPVATSKLPEKLAPSRQDIYQGASKI